MRLWSLGKQLRLISDVSPRAEDNGSLMSDSVTSGTVSHSLSVLKQSVRES